MSECMSNEHTQKKVRASLSGNFHDAADNFACVLCVKAVQFCQLMTVVGNFSSHFFYLWVISVFCFACHFYHLTLSNLLRKNLCDWQRCFNCWIAFNDKFKVIPQLEVRMNANKFKGKKISWNFIYSAKRSNSKRDRGEKTAESGNWNEWLIEMVIREFQQKENNTKISSTWLEIRLWKRVLTIFSRLRKTPNLPKRTWNGEHTKLPSASSTTITSIAPVSVAPLISL